MPKTVLHMPSHKNYYFKDIGWLLLIKICLIIAIRLIFFSHPLPKPDRMTLTATHLLGASAPATHSPLPENRRSL